MSLVVHRLTVSFNLPCPPASTFDCNPRFSYSVRTTDHLDDNLALQLRSKAPQYEDCLWKAYFTDILPLAMGFFKSLKGNHPQTVGGSPGGNTYPSTSSKPSLDQKKYHADSSSATEYEPPPGPPPGWNVYHPPPGPPPSHEEYAPPPGPPPSQLHTSADPPPYHDWTVIPDTSLLAPPPELGHDRSPSGNASTYDADRAQEWCRLYPLTRPHQPTPQQHASVLNGDVRFTRPKEYGGDLVMVNTGSWSGSTGAGSKDSCLLTSFPLYFACADSPLDTEAAKTVYFEIKIRSLGRGRGNDESSIAIGYCSIPYPPWRMPGWERGSLGVHGDDGRKYVNDSFGGKDFTSAFRTGETIGLGMTFSLADSSPGLATQSRIEAKTRVEVFLTRNGRKDRGWNLHEELDADNDRGVEGLEGQFDLYGAIGIFGGIDFDVFFNRRDWLWQPR